jgi:hypothetical protein
MHKPYRKQILVVLIVLAGLLISSCGGGQADLTPTVGIDMMQTQAVSTFMTGLTQTAQAMPTSTPTATATLFPTNTPAPTTAAGTPGAPAGGTGGTPSACYGLTFAADVTIPDNTVMNAGQTFTKTWQVLNTGTCAWEVGFKLAFVNGDAMGGVTYVLNQAIPAGAMFEISVPMTAPSAQGTIRGNWRMQTAAGEFFGDALYVVIVVGGTATPTP